MNLEVLEFAPETLYRIGAIAAAVVLLVLLVVSFLSRARMFCQYLSHMTGIRLKPSQVRKLYKKRGRAGVRDMLIELLIREDLADTSRVVTPDSKPDHSIYEEDLFA